MVLRRLFRFLFCLFLPVIFTSIVFPSETADFWRWLFWGQAPIPQAALSAFYILFTNLLIFVLFALIWSIIICAQAVLPVTSLGEVVLTVIYLFFHYLGLHGMAAYVRNGKIKAWVEELQLTLPGVVVVDYNSAVAVERVVLEPGLLRMVVLLIRALANLIGLSTPAVHIQGTGLLFTLPDERIHGANDLITYPQMSDPATWMSEILSVVDLRNQFRMSARQPHPLSKRLGNSVSAYTRDGIEVRTNISVVTTLGQDPSPYFPLNVTYIGDQHPRNLRVVKLKNISKQTGVYRVRSITDDLDMADRLEIHQQWQLVSNWVPYTDTPKPSTLPIFNCRRVFSAIYARARHHLGLVDVDEIVPWFDLPIHVAIDVFREIISHYNYDQIIDPNVGTNLIRSKLASAMRNNGLLSYRPVFLHSGDALQVDKNYAATSLMSVPPSSAHCLETSKVLRDRGIRVIACSFGDLNVDERIYKQRLDHWRATWDRDTEILEADSEWESLRVRTRARVQTQQEFVQTLAQIYQANGNSQEILAMRVLQALEMAATDPKTRQLLPETTFAILRSIHDWLLPGDIGTFPSGE